MYDTQTALVALARQIRGPSTKSVYLSLCLQVYWIFFQAISLIGRFLFISTRQSTCLPLNPSSSVATKSGCSLLSSMSVSHLSPSPLSLSVCLYLSLLSLSRLFSPSITHPLYPLSLSVSLRLSPFLSASFRSAPIISSSDRTPVFNKEC